MHSYLKFDEKIITDFSDQNISALYNQGYVFGRVEKGYISQTRSLRIDLSQFELSSENRRVLKKTESVKIEKHPLPYSQYHFSIGKLGKDFYETKFGAGTFSANKIKELMTVEQKSNFNCVFVYTMTTDAVGARYILPLPTDESAGVVEIHELPQPLNVPMAGVGAYSNTPLPPTVGYTICYENPEILHYCYPFYRTGEVTPPLPTNLGLGMMLKAIILAKDVGKKYVYLGSFSRPSDTYKLQFAGLEWWDGAGWEKNVTSLKYLE